MMPYKKFEQMCTAQVYLKRAAEDQNWQEWRNLETEINNLMSAYHWPWNANGDQLSDWNSLLRRLDP